MKELIEKIDYTNAINNIDKKKSKNKNKNTKIKINNINDNKENINEINNKEINDMNNYIDINSSNNNQPSELDNNIDINEENSINNKKNEEIDIIELNKELIEAKKTISTMTDIISNLKKELLSKDEYIKENINNNTTSISNETNINQKKLIDMLLMEKKQLEEKNQNYQKQIEEIEKTNYKNY